MSGGVPNAPPWLARELTRLFRGPLFGHPVNKLLILITQVDQLPWPGYRNRHRIAHQAARLQPPGLATHALMSDSYQPTQLRPITIWAGNEPSAIRA